MEFISILERDRSPYKEDGMPNFLVDLNLDQVLERISKLWGEDVAALYYHLPADKDCEAYRRAIYADVKRDNIYVALTAFVEEIKKYKKIIANKEVVKSQQQKAIWYAQEVVQYGKALEGLYDALQKEDIASLGMQLLRDFLQKYLQSDEFQQMYLQAKSLIGIMADFRVRLVYENNMVKLEVAEETGRYDDFLRSCFPEVEESLKSPFEDSPSLKPLEREVVKIYAKKKPEFFKECESFYEKDVEYAEPRLLTLAQELPYYLAYYKFEQKMQESGFDFAVPAVDEEHPIYACGLYDLALACVNVTEHKEVIGNNMEYREGESFFVVTGPNQGGKTTFARSLGQLMYLSKMGLDVPAKTANVHSFRQILTHFSVEESVETGRGKLQEELSRLQPMMSVEGNGAFVIINELFTTAANYDACIMGKRVLTHFIERQCRGIYVTHLAELSKAHESVVSMCATLDEEGLQTHKIVRMEAGEVACAINQVNKHRLNYEQLKERLG